MDLKQYRELDRIDGEPMEFEWMIFPGFTTLQILLEIQKLMTDLIVSQNNSKEESFMSMYSGIVRGDPHNERVCLANSTLVAECAKKFSVGHWSFLGPRSETKWNATSR